MNFELILKLVLAFIDVSGIQFQLNARENFLKVTTKKSGKKRIEGA